MLCQLNVENLTHIKDRIEYDNLKTLEEAMRKANFCYEQNCKKESMANQKAKRNNNYEQKKKEFVPNRNSTNNNTRNFPSKNFQGNKSNSQTNQNNQRNKESATNHSNYKKNFELKEPIKCWACNGPHYALVFPIGRRLLATYTQYRKRLLLVIQRGQCLGSAQHQRTIEQIIKLPWWKWKVIYTKYLYLF